MKSTRLVLTVLSLLTLGGVWLFVAPFGLGSQAAAARWSTATINDVATGGALILVGLVSLATYCALSTRDLLKRAPVLSAQAEVPSGPLTDQ